MATREESHGIIKPIIIGVVTTVLSTAILYWLNLDQARQRYHEPPRVEVHQRDMLPERPRDSAYERRTSTFQRRDHYHPLAPDISDERSRRYDELQTIMDRYNRTAKDIIDSMGR
jgi:hypothetical protein